MEDGTIVGCRRLSPTCFIKMSFSAWYVFYLLVYCDVAASFVVVVVVAVVVVVVVTSA